MIPRVTSPATSDMLDWQFIDPDPIALLPDGSTARAKWVGGSYEIYVETPTRKLYLGAAGNIVGVNSIVLKYLNPPASTNEDESEDE